MDTLTVAILGVGFIFTAVGIIVLTLGEMYIIRTARDIQATAWDVAAMVSNVAAMVSDVAVIQRAIFLQLRRQYQDIDRDLKELRDLSFGFAQDRLQEQGPKA